MKRFLNLPKAQADTFEQIACGNDRGVNRRTAEALIEKSLIIQREQNMGRGLTIFRYEVPIPVHMEWCQWCSEQPENHVL